MSISQRLTPSFVTMQLQIQRQNLSSVCRLAVKSLVERSGLGIIDDGCRELDNCINILEHIFNHRLKPNSTWYGGHEPRCFWDYIRVVCQRVPHNCLASVDALELPHTPLGKGRAWIRMCLMEKRLADYITTAVNQTKTTESFYDEGSIMLSDDVHMLADLLLGLNCIDFSLDLKGNFLDYPATPAIDFAPFLKYDSRDGASYPPIANLVEGETLDGDQLGTEFWKTKYNKLEEQYKITNDQKNYAEEMLRLRENQLTEAYCQRQSLAESLEYLQTEKKRDQTQLESVIVELQSQLIHLMEENSLLVQRMQTSRRRSQDVITMSELLSSEARRSRREEMTTDRDQAIVEMDAIFPESERKPDGRSSFGVHSKLVDSESQADVKSTYSDTSNISAVPISNRAEGREDTLSTGVLAGSFSSAMNTYTGIEDSPSNL